MNNEQHPQSAQPIHATPTPSADLVQLVLDDPASHFISTLSRLREIILALRTDEFTSWGNDEAERQAQITGEIYELASNLRERLLACHIRLETLERATVQLDIIEDAHWVFDQISQTHALACAKYALIAAHDTLLTLAGEV